MRDNPPAGLDPRGPGAVTPAGRTRVLLAVLTFGSAVIATIRLGNVLGRAGQWPDVSETSTAFGWCLLAVIVATRAAGAVSALWRTASATRSNQRRDRSLVGRNRRVISGVCGDKAVIRSSTVAVRPRAYSAARLRLMTTRWIWFVPSKICMTFTSRMKRSTG